jgi:hypothetical protein
MSEDFFAQRPSPINLSEVGVSFDFPTVVGGEREYPITEIKIHRILTIKDLIKEVGLPPYPGDGVAEILGFEKSTAVQELRHRFFDIKEKAVRGDVVLIVGQVNAVVKAWNKTSPVINIVEPVSLLDKTPGDTHIYYELSIKFSVLDAVLCDGGEPGA